ncbi:succinate--CoA ligase beta chain, partial [Cryomyces antarcticus]
MFKLARSRQLVSAFKAARDTPLKRAAFQQTRALSIHEYRSAQLLDLYGIGVPHGAVAFSAQEAEAVAKTI